MSCWVGAYIEAGASAGKNQPTPYLAFAFCGPASKADAQKQAAAKLLAGPFADQAAAQKWADSYNKNPANPKAGSGLTPGTGVVVGDKPPPGTGGLLTGINAIGDFFQRLGQANTWIRVGEVVLGVALLSVGFAKITGTTPIVETALKTAGKVVK